LIKIKIIVSALNNIKTRDMKIAIIGANGKIGSRIAEEAISRGHTVTGICRSVRRGEKNDRIHWINADVLDTESIANAIKGHDAVVSAFGIDWQNPETYPLFNDVAKSVLKAARKASVKRVINVGGAGSLEVAPGVQLVDTPSFPDMWRAGANEQRKSLEIFRSEKDLDWTFFSPAIIIEPGPRTGKYRLGKDNPVFDEKGESNISFDDYAKALIDELEKPAFIRQRFTIGY
jgi:putative NADH-flavin reductase